MPTPLSKGQNGPLTASDVVVSLELTTPADLSALLVKADGKVRSDADFVFFNQPTGPGVRLVPGAPGQAASLAVSLAQVPADIDQVRAVITLDDASSNFGRFAPPTARVSDSAGTVLYEYRIDGLSTESIVIALELYRRQGAWKVRAVGQGYAGGFAALVTDHGVSVDDAPAQPAAAPQPDAPTPAPAPPVQQTPPPAYPAQPASPAQPAEVSLTKSRPVSLVKGQKVTLRKDGGVALTFLRMGLGWDPVEKRGLFGNRSADIDLDASAVMFADNQIADVVYYGQLQSKDGSIQHQGDNLTGAGEGDDEVMLVDLTRVPAHVTTVMFIVTSYKGHTFEQVQNAFCRLVDGTIDTELARYTLQGGMPFTGMVMAKVYRQGSEWKLQAIGEGMQAKHPGEAAPQLGRFLAV
ncbi:Stress response protein SCP2 [Rhodococcus rhodochrous J3]|uniref:TerD family protein n=2 Tax=Rhodococcus rhodochrous TaxID=1829 RepID=A0AA46WVA5_RHORH|nr:TerD family protein [Rhodococcus rhodochrous]MBF4480338.1 TerD family protein [Rhodococcus rhodochrous]MCB8911662.1 TerD family protein [Rhodococcus rhodochrous]MDJ0397504.1 TerD family protein [Rhodococcus rhodochrous]TWH44883.1 stress response protein SCP2 [Rhodococcus rhodochrous J38]UZF44970.1 TerD family protein [Rhodococcus rhodochrous]